LQDQREFDAEVIGRDRNTDLALIKLKDADNLPVIKLGDSDALKVGQWVIAVGSPFGLEHTVTAGIVSAKGRVIGSGPYDDFIQTDASINPGNSGGPLVNLNGELVGINTAIIASGQGIGFAIPVNLARGIFEQLKAEGSVTRGWLGVAIQDINEELAEYYGLEEKKGVLVAEVFEGDPADEAGINARDIILEVNGKKVESSRELTGLIAGLRVGEIAEIKILRKGIQKIFSVKISKREDDRLFARESARDEEDELGMRVSNLTPELSRRFDIKEAKGVVVTKVEFGGKASDAGIQSGDLIKEINHQPIETVDDYKLAIQKIKVGEIAHLFIRRANVGFIVIKLTK
jgi:serine protease Do